MKRTLLLFAVVTFTAWSQDTISHQWPVTPFSTSQSITGTFCEFRNTLSSNHFHNGTDIPKADGSPVYAVLDGTVSTISPSSVSGTSAYVRVTGTVNGVSKNMAYVHIEPSPSLVLGQTVTKGVTILGNILSGQGHVHLIDGAFNSELNSLRKNGGLEPYIDTWKPKVISVEYYLDNSSTKFSGSKVYGLFDIVAQLVEVNANASPNSGSTSNNGVYHTGFKIYSADKSTVVYTPASNGVRYKFDWKPNDSHSNIVYTLSSSTSQHIYYLTNGTGNIGTSRLQSVSNSAFNSTLLPPGQYQVMVYAQDTHGNADTVFVPLEISAQDVVAPAPPVLLSVLNDSTNRVTVRWRANTEPDLKGYRLYSSLNGTTWMLQKDEAVLPAGTTSYTFNGITSTTPVYFRLCAVDSAAITNVSGFSDIYGTRPNLAGSRVLIVDGFDRTSGSYKQSSHGFAMTAGQSVPTRFETAHNSAVVNGSVPLSAFTAVIWNFGDESSTDETFGDTEQSIAAAYLTAGGTLFVTGSEVAYDLDRASGPSVADRDFMNAFLKADYAGDASGSFTVNGTAFMQGISFSYGDTLQGSPYREDYPDYLTPASGAIVAATYGNGLNAMTAYSGPFKNGSNSGSIVLLALPFETIHTKAERDAVMQKVLTYIGALVTTVERTGEAVPQRSWLGQNYPNPFNPSTTIRYAVAGKTPVPVRLAVYDILGKEIAVLADNVQQPGEYTVQWNASHFASGIYFYRVQTAGYTETRRLVLTK